MMPSPTIDIDFEAFFQSAAVGMFRRHFDGHFSAANPALLQLLEVPVIDALNNADNEVPDGRDERERIWKVFENDGVVNGLESRWRTGTGGVITVRLNGRMVTDEEGRPVGYEAIAEDVTERRSYEHALRRARDEAEESSRERMALFANLNHEIRTPLTAIIGFSSLLAREVPEQQRRHAELVEESARRLLETLNSVLTYARLNGSTPQLRLEPVDCCLLVHDVVARFKTRASAKGLSLTFDVDGDGPWFIWGDEDALSTICDGVMSNALKFTDQGGIRLQLTRSDTHLSIIVSDTGIGIDPAVLPYVFEPFRQGTHPDRTRQGSGLGLAIARQLMEALGGSIYVESSGQAGTTFKLSFVPLDRIVDGAP